MVLQPKYIDQNSNNEKLNHEGCFLSNYIEGNRQWKRSNREFAKILPEVASKFNALTAEVYQDGKLTRKTKVLLALAVSLAIKCEHCATNHLLTALKLGIQKEELAEVISVLITVMGGSGWLQKHLFDVYEAFQKGEIAI